MKNILYIVNFFLEKIFKVNRAKDIMINSDKFDTSNLNLGNTFIVNEDINVKKFISKIVDEKLTIVVVDKKGQTKGYINKNQINKYYGKKSTS